MNTESCNIAGFLNIDKPAGITSFAVVNKLRRITGIKKIGHAGTLDPFATGVLIVAIGRAATRQIDKFVKQDKSYLAKLKLGATTETLDTESEEIVCEDVDVPNFEEIEKTSKSFLGEQEQIPPMYSAKKIGGKKLYEIARAGKTIERKASVVTIHSICVLDYNWPFLELDISCSSGTYIRSLAKDIGEALGTMAYLSELRRTRIGRIDISDSYKLAEIKKDNFAELFFERL